MSEKETEKIETLIEERGSVRNDYVNLKSLTRKVDFRIIPLLFITYSLQFMDKLALSSSSVFGVREDNHLVGQDYSWVSSIFYFGYLAGQFPVTRMVQIVPIGKFIGATVTLWGVVLACSASSESYVGLLVARFFLGLLESAVSPVFVIVTSMWYRVEQQPARTAIWFGGNDFGGIVSGFIAFGLGHIRGSLNPWRYIFIIYGAMTVFWGIILMMFLPDCPEKASFLTLQEKEYYSENHKNSQITREWKWDQFFECFLDIKTWLLVALCILNILPNGGVISYGFIIIESFGFSSINTTLLNVPASLVTWLSILFTGYVSSRFKSMRLWMIIFTVIPPIAGAAIISKVPLHRKGVKLFGYYLLMIQPATFPNILALISSNYQGTTKKATMSAIIFIFYCASNVAAPQLFILSEAPNYSVAYNAWISTFAITVLIALIMRFYLQWENGRRGKMEEKNEASDIDKNNDISDLNDKSFIYQY
ncbi:uncharacterized protein PRCAT00005835001 [Priceomyces carsonii]|uniref:uncharacterized protein n=1 Tax=Priceomyces carsonii TaxID=28549 RepID=UPI002EDA7F5C|nr:unnamed protein product [Priceomyces carsonii]